MCKARGGGTGEATTSQELRAFTTEKFQASWIYEVEKFSCFTGKKLIPTPLCKAEYHTDMKTREIVDIISLY